MDQTGGRGDNTKAIIFFTKKPEQTGKRQGETSQTNLPPGRRKGEKGPGTGGKWDGVRFLSRASWEWEGKGKRTKESRRNRRQVWA